MLGGQYASILEVAPSDNEYIYSGNGNFLWMTSDAGLSWQNISGGLITVSPVSDVTISHNNPEKLWASLQGFSEGYKVFKSEDGGQSWENISLNLPNVPVNCLTYENDVLNGIYAGTDIGIYYINDNLSEWVDFSNGLPNVIVLEMEINYKENKIKSATYGRGLWESPLINPSVSVPEIARGSFMLVFPNPSNGKFTLVADHGQAEMPVIRIFDMQGRCIDEFKLNSGEGKEYIGLDLTGQPKGTYILQLSSGSDTKMTRRIILQ
jgi:hypothetical protein